MTTMPKHQGKCIIIILLMLLLLNLYIVTIKKYRFLHQEHDTQYGVKGHNVNLYWFVYGYPKPKMQYYFDNQLIELGGRYDSSYTRNGQATVFINK